MQQANFNGYLTVKSVSPPRPMEKQARNGATLYRVEAVATAIAERVYSEATSKYENVWREFDLTFSELTENHAKIITADCEISIFGAIVFSYMIEVGYTAAVALPMARMDDPSLSENVIKPDQLINGIVSVIGEEHRESLNKIIPREKRKTIINVKPGQWALRSSSANMQDAQEVEVCISGEV